MVSSRPVLIARQTDAARVSVQRLSALLVRRDLRVALVRGYDDGDHDRAMV